MSIQRGHPDTTADATVQVTTRTPVHWITLGGQLCGSPSASSIGSHQGGHGRQDTARRLKGRDVAGGIYVERKSGDAGVLLAPSPFKGQF